MKGNYKVIDSAGRVVLNTLNRDEEECFSDGKVGVLSLHGGKARLGSRSNAIGSVFLASRDPSLVKSGKVFKSSLNLLVESLEYLIAAVISSEEKSTAKSKRLVHNLTSLNGHMIHDLYVVLPQERLAGNIRKEIPFIASEMKGAKADDFAKCFLSLAKHSAAMKNEFSVFKKINSLETSVNKRSHSLHKVLMNVAYLFFSDFADVDSFVDIAESDLKVQIDYECAFVALYHLFDNAAKYVCRGTNLDISIASIPGGALISFSMCSLAIAESELDQLALEGFSGTLPRRLELNGDGVGLSLVQRVMDLHGGSLQIRTDPQTKFLKDDAEYQRNTFVLTFPG